MYYYKHFCVPILPQTGQSFMALVTLESLGELVKMPMPRLHPGQSNQDLWL